MMGIQAIETRYRGFRFRSRLEARWAVCFDALGLEWDYEREGYQVNNLFYLPDFYFSHFIINKPAIVEIKPSVPAPDSEDAHKIMALTKALAPDIAVFVITGSPNPDLPLTLAHIMDGDLSLALLGYVERTKKMQLIALDFLSSEWNVLQDDGLTRFAVDLYDPSPATHSTVIINALTKARSARFEFNEKG